MRRNRKFLVVILFLCAIDGTGTCLAEVLNAADPTSAAPPQPQSNVPAVPATSDSVGKGDRVALQVRVNGFYDVSGRLAAQASRCEAAAACLSAPAYSVLWIDGPGVTASTIWVHFICVNRGSNDATVFGIHTCHPKGPVSATQVTEGVPYEIDSATFSTNSYAIEVRGVTYGVLIAPYKFHLSDHTFASSATVGGYVGYERQTPGVGITFPLSAGLGVVPISTTQNGSITTDNKAALSVASGVILTLTKAGRFQVGVLTGIDWAGRSSQYKYEGKPWVALSFGTSLTSSASAK